jgi:hypothetical protein
VHKLLALTLALLLTTSLSARADVGKFTEFKCYFNVVTKTMTTGDLEALTLDSRPEAWIAGQPCKVYRRGLNNKDWRFWAVQVPPGKQVLKVKFKWAEQTYYVKTVFELPTQKEFVEYKPLILDLLRKPNQW